MADCFPRAAQQMQALGSRHGALAVWAGCPGSPL